MNLFMFLGLFARSHGKLGKIKPLSEELIAEKVMESQVYILLIAMMILKPLQKELYK